MTTILYQRITQNFDQKVSQRQNTVCLEQQIYASPENFTPTLLVMLETFGRSAYPLCRYIFFFTKVCKYLLKPS